MKIIGYCNGDTSNNFTRFFSDPSFLVSQGNIFLNILFHFIFVYRVAQLFHQTGQKTCITKLNFSKDQIFNI